jgi:hypothetical protein
MLRSAITRGPFKRIGRRLPLGSLLIAGELAVMAGRHVARLDATQRRRLVELLGKSGARPSSLSAAERQELAALLASLEPRLFLGSALRRLSPMPLPKRLLYGRRDSSARKAARERS